MFNKRKEFLCFVFSLLLSSTWPLYALSDCSNGLDVRNIGQKGWQALPNDTISGFFDYNIWNRSDGNALMLILVGIKDQSGNVVGDPVGVYGPRVPGRCQERGDRGSANFSIQVPPNEGKYEVVVYGVSAYDYSDAANKFRNNVDYPTFRLGVLQVDSGSRSEDGGHHRGGQHQRGHY